MRSPTWAVARFLASRGGWLLGALALDLVGGEPPDRLHPVVWIGRAIAWFEQAAPSQDQRWQFGWGAGMSLAVVGGAWACGVIANRVIARLPRPLGWVAGAWLLKTSLSVGTLAAAAERVRQALAAGDLPAARAGLRWLVSRDTAGLDASRLAAAAIESVAENLSDSFVAPSLAFLLFGLPGALAYRAANTLDSMVGYRGRYEWLGKAPARLDDALNLVPARLSALLIALACLPDAEAARRALGIAHRDATGTASPNAGRPMAAMAGALGVELEKRGHYVLGRGQRLPQPADIARANRIFARAVALFTVLALLLAARRPHAALSPPCGREG